MILAFSKEQFVQKILDGTKIHTIREDKHSRWKPGMKIHFWKGNPRNVKANPYPFATGTVTKVDQIEIHYTPDGKGLQWIEINGEVLRGVDKLEELARNDGFDGLKSFMVWFKEDFKGKLIHWEINEKLI